MMRPFRANFCLSCFGFGHEVVDDKKHSLLVAVQNFHIGNTLHKFETVDCSEQILVTTETPNHPLWRRIDGTPATNQLEVEIVLCHIESDRLSCK